MLPRPLRLTKDREIKAVIKDGQRINTPHVGIHYLANSDHPSSRLAVIVSKKVAASSVRRHRYQRWLRAAARPILPAISSPTDLVLIARPSITSVGWAELKRSLDLYLKQLI